MAPRASMHDGTEYLCLFGGGSPIGWMRLGVVCPLASGYVHRVGACCVAFEVVCGFGVAVNGSCCGGVFPRDAVEAVGVGRARCGLQVVTKGC